ncbi:MurR/RpiR family transcriptional regulator [Deinococcus altitudinis]|uniref:MurR/RpiR family transcriptional regulator n=1 Tax=Deinococcus altitudinis TaxID=468914 RepID=UPI003892C044
MPSTTALTPQFQDRHGVSELLHHELPLLSGAQRTLALYVLGNLERVPFLSATDLALAAGVSQSSVTRFAVRLGFGSYPQFTTSVGEALLREPAAHAPADRFERAAPGTPYTAALKQEAHAVTQLGALLASDDFRRAAALLAAAEHLTVVGFAAAAALAVHASLYLSRLRPHTSTHTALDAALMTQVTHWNSRGAALLIAAPRPATDTVRVLHLMRQRGVPVVLVSDPANLAVLGPGEVTLIVPVTLGPTTAIPAAMLTLTSLLVDAVALAHPERTRTALRSFEDLSAGVRLFAGVRAPGGAPPGGVTSEPGDVRPGSFGAGQFGSGQFGAGSSEPGSLHPGEDETGHLDDRPDEP